MNETRNSQCRADECVTRATLNAGSGRTNDRPRRMRKKARGQAAVIIAISAILLIAMVGLAIDGGSMYNQRRIAQNGSDGAAMAGTRIMLQYYEDMIHATWSDIDEYPTLAEAQNREYSLRQQINAYAAANGVFTPTLEAYYVNTNKQVVTVPNGIDRGRGHCGWGGGNRPCEVGENGVMPWTLGARGIMVKSQAQTNTFFMGALGWNTVSAVAEATAYMGVAVDSGYDVKLLPIGFFTDTEHLDDMQVGEEYTLISGGEENGVPLPSGNWGWISYKGESPNANVLRAWMACGFNPSVTAETWPDWCLDSHYNNVQGAEGPVAYWTGWPDDGEPITGMYLGLTLRFGEGLDGWWVAGTTGTKSSACQYFGDISGGDYIVPAFDVQGGGGSGTLYHLVRLAKFTITTVDVQCNGPHQRWIIKGIYRDIFTQSSSGWHGDIRHNSLHTIFMGP
jgi:hypothetical protein